MPHWPAALLVVTLAGQLIVGACVSESVNDQTAQPEAVPAALRGRICQKYVPAVRVPAAYVVPAWFVVSYVNAEYLDYALKLAPVTLLSILMCSTIAMAASSLSASSARATVTSYLIVAAIMIVPLIAWWLSGILLAPRVAAWIAMVSPMSIALDLRPALAGHPLTRDLFNYHLVTIGGV